MEANSKTGRAASGKRGFTLPYIYSPTVRSNMSHARILLQFIDSLARPGRVMSEVVEAIHEYLDKELPKNPTLALCKLMKGNAILPAKIKAAVDESQVSGGN